MNRKSFFKRLGLGVGVALIAPKILIPEVKPEKSDYLRDFKQTVRTSGGSGEYDDWWSEGDIFVRQSAIKKIVAYPGYRNILVNVESTNRFQLQDVVVFDNIIKAGIVYAVMVNPPMVAVKAIGGRFSKNIAKAKYLKIIGSAQKS